MFNIEGDEKRTGTFINACAPILNMNVPWYGGFIERIP
jgi:hypothetical protein